MLCKLITAAEKDDTGGAGTALAQPDAGLRVNEFGIFMSRTFTLAAGSLSQSSDQRRDNVFRIDSFFETESRKGQPRALDLTGGWPKLSLLHTAQTLSVDRGQEQLQLVRELAWLSAARIHHVSIQIVPGLD